MKAFVRIHDWHPIYTVHSEKDQQPGDVTLEIPDEQVAALARATEAFRAAHFPIECHMREHENQRDAAMIEAMDSLGLHIV